MYKKKYYKRKYYPRRTNSPRLSPRGITVPVSFTQRVILSNTADTIQQGRPRLDTSPLYNKFQDIYNKYKVQSITIHVQPHQNSAYFYDIKGVDEPLKYVVYRVSPDTIGTNTNPTSFREAMSMPGAKAYPFNRACTRTRIALMGIVREYCTDPSFTTTNVTPVRGSVRAPWMSTSMTEADDPYLYGWAVWWPQINANSDVMPTFEMINVCNVRFVSAVNLA